MADLFQTLRGYRLRFLSVQGGVAVPFARTRTISFQMSLENSPWDLELRCLAETAMGAGTWILSDPRVVLCGVQMLETPWIHFKVGKTISSGLDWWTWWTFSSRSISLFFFLQTNTLQRILWDQLWIHGPRFGPNSSVRICGRNGCGKSTLMTLICSEMNPTENKVAFLQTTRKWQIEM